MIPFIKKSFVYWWLKSIWIHWKTIKDQDLFQLKCKIVNKGVYNIKKCIIGGGNKIIIGKDSVLDHVYIRIVGENNVVNIGSNCYIGKNCSIWLEGNNVSVVVGNYCTFTHDTQLCAQENSSRIEIGSDCMFSHHINVRTSDSHLIYDKQTDRRLNIPQNVLIGDHVWIAPEAKIMKGCTIGGGSIIGSNSIVTKNIPENTLVVGIPAKVVKTNVSWKRDKLF